MFFNNFIVDFFQKILKAKVRHRSINGVLYLFIEKLITC